MPLNTRSFVCGGCGNVENRDVNAAYNVLEAGRSLGSGATPARPRKGLVALLPPNPVGFKPWEVSEF
jgi:transposase